ncbi:MAG: MFS transporter [Kineosporiaceae bacterium]
MFPAINADRFGGRPQTLGLFLSAIAVGGILAGAASGLVTRAARPGAVMLGAVWAWSLGLAAFGLAQPLWLTLASLAVAGAADTVSVIARGAVIQLVTDDDHRGRVSSLELVVGAAGPDVGNLRGGLVAGVTSPAFAVVSGALACLAGIAFVTVTNTSLRRFTVRADRDDRPRVRPPRWRSSRRPDRTAQLRRYEAQLRKYEAPLRSRIAPVAHSAPGEAR